MKFNSIFLAIITALLLVSCERKSSEETSSARAPDPVEDAFRVCDALTKTGLTTECNVKGFEGFIDVRIDMNSSEARKTCVGAVELIRKQTQSLSTRWQLRIFSPYSGDHPIATCPF